MFDRRRRYSDKQVNCRVAALCPVRAALAGQHDSRMRLKRDALAALTSQYLTVEYHHTGKRSAA